MRVRTAEGKIEGSIKPTGEYTSTNAISFSDNTNYRFIYNATYSFECWIKRDNLSGNCQCNIFQCIEGVNTYKIKITGIGNLQLYYSGTGNAIYLTLDDVIPISEWVHCIITNNAGTHKIYINGVESDYTAAGTAMDATFTGACVIGMISYSNGTAYFDELAIYDGVALSQKEITYRYQNGRNMGANTLAHYTLEDISDGDKDQTDTTKSWRYGKISPLLIFDGDFLNYDYFTGDVSADQFIFAKFHGITLTAL